MGDEAGAPRSTRAAGWRGSQVALVAALALLLGLATGALLVTSDEDEATEPSPSASQNSATTSTEPSPPPPAEDADGREDNVSDGASSVVVGNSVYTASYQSNTDKSTEPFEVDDTWEIRWDVDAGTVTIKVMDSGGGTVEVIEAEGRGERRFPHGGTYQIDIDTEGSRYGVLVTDGP